MITDQLLKQIHFIAAKYNRPVAWQEIRRSWMLTTKLTEAKAKACFHTLEMIGAGVISTDGQGAMRFRAHGQFG